MKRCIPLNNLDLTDGVIFLGARKLSKKQDDLF